MSFMNPPQTKMDRTNSLLAAGLDQPQQFPACAWRCGQDSHEKRRINMRAMRAEQFSGYEGLKLVELPKPTVTDGKVLVRITAAGVTPLDHTILSGQFHHSKAPLVLGNEGAGVVEQGGGSDFPVGSRVMFWGAYGAFEDGTYREWIAVRKEDLCLIPDNVDDVSAAGIPVAYLTAQVALTLAGFRAGKTVLAPAIGGSVGNAVTQLARALGAKHAISSTTSHAKAEQAKALGFDEVIDTSLEKLSDGVRRITGGIGADIVIDGIGGEVLGEALKTLASNGNLITLGYSASRKTTIDVTDLIVPQTSIRGFNMFSQPQAAVTDAWTAIAPLLQSGAIKPIVAKTFPLVEAAEALRYLVEDRPFGRVVLTV
jgi:NADPH:quinone reductase